MSYVRFAWDGSDVYVYEGSRGIECCGCHLGNSFSCETEEEMISHLAEHRRAGDFVPEYAITGLWNAIPGTTKAQIPEPPGLSKSSLMLQAARLQIEIERLAKLEAEQDAKDDKEISRVSNIPGTPKNTPRTTTGSGRRPKKGHPRSPRRRA